MLFKEAIDASVLKLLRSLQKREYLKGFYLAGGTALALYNGHRRSVDIDLFSDFAFDTMQMLENINQDFDFDLFFSASNTLKGAVHDIKVEIIAHRYPLLKDPVSFDDISVLSEEDIVAMKFNAILTSGQRIKDFIDIYYLLEKYDIKTMLIFYTMKYSQKNDLLVLKSLIYFEDVDESEWPVMIKDPGLKWKDVRKRIEKEVFRYIREKRVSNK